MTPRLQHSILPLLLALIAILGVQTHAQQAGGNRFQQYDKNADGKVTRKETGNAPWFDTLDRNRDGVITREEAVEAARAKPRPGGGGPAAAMAYDPGSTRPMPLSESKAFTDLRFSRDLVFWHAGPRRQAHDRHRVQLLGCPR